MVIREDLPGLRERILGIRTNLGGNIEAESDRD
jgi:hypothetical protein